MECLIWIKWITSIYETSITNVVIEKLNINTNSNENKDFVLLLTEALNIIENVRNQCNVYEMLMQYIIIDE